MQLVGDDVFVTNPEILKRGIADGVGNALLVKLNQIGTVTETLDAVRDGARRRLRDDHLAPLGRDRGHDDRRPGRRHRAGQIKTGSASRTDRVCKYNQLLRIEEELGVGGASTPGRSAISARLQRDDHAMHTLVLLRHGESTWNKENRFTGWTDVDLSERGRDEAQRGRPAAEAKAATSSTSPTRRC